MTAVLYASHAKKYQEYVKQQQNSNFVFTPKFILFSTIFLSLSHFSQRDGAEMRKISKYDCNFKGVNAGVITFHWSTEVKNNKNKTVCALYIIFIYTFSTYIIKHIYMYIHYFHIRLTKFKKKKLL